MGVVREQFAAATALERDYTGVGFYTKISVPSSMPPMPETAELHDALLDGAVARPKSDPEGCTLFLLWTDGGYLSCLEGVTVRDTWPDEDDVEVLKPSEVPRDASTRFSAEDLMPDCENTFAVWRMNTTFRTLLMASVCALLVAMIVGCIAMVLLADVL
jgi:hypothetical protein